MSCGACWAFAVAVVKLCEYVCTIWTCGNVYVTFLLSLWELSLITYCAKDKASSPHWGYIVKVFFSMLMRSEGDLEIILRWVESKGKWLDQNQFKYNKCCNSWLYFESFFVNEANILTIITVVTDILNVIIIMPLHNFKVCLNTTSLNDWTLNRSSYFSSISPRTKLSTLKTMNPNPISFQLTVDANYKQFDYEVLGPSSDQSLYQPKLQNLPGLYMKQACIGG